MRGTEDQAESEKGARRLHKGGWFIKEAQETDKSGVEGWYNAWKRDGRKARREVAE
jgi:hypothetical protein